MSTKVFSTRLKPHIIEQIKQFSRANSVNISEALETLLKNNQEKLKVDPWLEFSGCLPADDDFEEIIKEKRAKNLKIRTERKQND